MTKRMHATPIDSGTSWKGQQREIVELAFQYWQARFGVQDGSPEEDLLRAEQEITARCSKARNTAGLFVVPGPQSQT